ncbi:hypothetical protein TH63_09340 [Rufibacter radiotolerans]|uniref:Uncharacterized protein n=1 Tax=Rufibacter radiotolerans TaxID=1379910 RepID=A0A0H4W5T7_9BACT|nr:hypothetical protein [Rufibacter radiotolerans]AKQ45801.1 hypothetical protein TH63_09340 [Rufibacter radiotolerans]
MDEQDDWEVNDDYDPQDWEDEPILNHDYYVRKFTSLVYHHPFFTYHSVPPDKYRSVPSFSEQNPFSIPLFTMESKEWGQTGIYPSDFNEKSVQGGFCFYIQRHDHAEIAEFLDYQFASYVERAAPKEDATAFLDYLITTIETFGEASRYDMWRDTDFHSLRAVGSWVRSHRGYIDAFEQRLWDWVNLNRDFGEMAKKENAKRKKEKTEEKYLANPDIKKADEEDAALERIYAKKPEQAILALCFLYLQDAGYVPFFQNHEGGKLKAIAEVVSRSHLKSVKSFQNHYNFINNNERRITLSNIPNLKKVMALLVEFPKAQRLVETEIKAADLGRA